VFSIGAIIFMWFLYPKQYDYHAQLDKSMFFYQANMVRCTPKDNHALKLLCYYQQTAPCGATTSALLDLQ